MQTETRTTAIITVPGPGDRLMHLVIWENEPHGLPHWHEADARAHAEHLERVAVGAAR